MVITKTKKASQAKLYEGKMFCNIEEYCTAEFTSTDSDTKVYTR